MALILADVGAQIILDAYLNNSWPASKDWTLKLFATNVTPAHNSVAGDFIVAVGGGYVNKTLSNGSWIVSALNDPREGLYNTSITWTFTGRLTTNGTIYGYYIIDASDGVLLWAEKFEQSFTPISNGDQLILTPKFQLSYGTPQ